MNNVNLSLIGSLQRFELPLVTGPSVIVLILPIVTLASCSSSLLTSACLGFYPAQWWWSFSFTNFCNFPLYINSSIFPFRSLHSLVVWLWSLWNWQCFFWAHLCGNEVKGFTHFKLGISLICSKTFSMGIFKGMKFTIFFKRLELTYSLFWLGERSLFFFFLCQDSSKSSIFHLPSMRLLYSCTSELWTGDLSSLLVESWPRRRWNL